MRELTLDDFDYALPPELVAQAPAPERGASRLLDVLPHALIDRRFGDLPQLLAAGDLLVFNDTKVMHARLVGRKASGGAVEVLVERVLDHERVLAMVRASKAPLPGSRLRLAEAFDAEVLGRERDFFVLRFPSEPAALIERHGVLPLPPYITHVPTGDDEQRYQTVFARTLGAVAAPTAGLHFDTALLQTLSAQGVQQARVTLHVGAGTFAPVRVHRLAEHRMHREWFEVPQATVDAVVQTRARGGRIVAVGTTTLRALESAARDAARDEAGDAPPEVGALQAGARETELFITPGFEFRVVDGLITNFHLPRSTLMMLVSAFAGHARIMSAYAHAVQARYRFFSYGDAMLLRRA